MSLVDTLLVVAILGILVLVFWSRIMHQTVLDTLREIKTFMSEMRTIKDE